MTSQPILSDMNDRTREVFHLLPDGSLVEMTAAPDGIAGEYTPVDGVPVIDEAVDRALAASGSAHLPALAAAFVRSPHAHARITDIRVTAKSGGRSGDWVEP